MADDIKRIDIAEFRRLGYLQELNRIFLHPLGMALEVNVADDDSETLSGIWDYRDDPEGMNYANPLPSDFIERASYVAEQWSAKRASRVRELGYMIQPAPGIEGDRVGADPWHEFVPGDQSTYPPNDDFYWATWKNGRVERQHFDVNSPFVDMLWRHCTHWAPIVPPASPNTTEDAGGDE